jgi:hypothetical protein
MAMVARHRKAFAAKYGGAARMRRMNLPWSA